MPGIAKKFCEGCHCVRPASEFKKAAVSKIDLCSSCRRVAVDAKENYYRSIESSAEKYLECERSIEKIKEQAEKEAKIYRDAIVVLHKKAKAAEQDFGFMIRNVNLSKDEILASIQKIITKKNLSFPESGMVIKGGSFRRIGGKIVIKFTGESKLDKKGGV